MFQRWRKRPLRLEFGERVVRFDKAGDFEFSLASRTEVPTAKVAELVRLDPRALEREATSIRNAQRHFVAVLSRSLESPGNIGYLLHEMDPKLFSQDHDWRDIMRALNQLERGFEEFKRIALVKYIQYLGSRQDVLQSIYANKLGAAAGGAVPEPDAHQAAMRETLIFDVTTPPSERASPRYTRLPRGETVTARIPDEGALELILSRHLFVLTSEDPPQLTDRSGRRQPLAPGLNVVGRLPDCAVVVDAGYRDVSRHHLVINLRDEDTVELTDLSSHGTFVPTEALMGKPAP
jgi:hypothetical protein